MKNYQSIKVWDKELALKEESYERLIEIITLAGELKEDAAPFDKIVNNAFVQ